MNVSGLVVDHSQGWLQVDRGGRLGEFEPATFSPPPRNTIFVRSPLWSRLVPIACPKEWCRKPCRSFTVLWSHMYSQCLRGGFVPPQARSEEDGEESEQHEATWGRGGIYTVFKPYYSIQTVFSLVGLPFRGLVSVNTSGLIIFNRTQPTKPRSLQGHNTFLDKYFMSMRHQGGLGPWTNTVVYLLTNCHFFRIEEFLEHFTQILPEQKHLWNVHLMASLLHVGSWIIILKLTWPPWII